MTKGIIVKSNNFDCYDDIDCLHVFNCLDEIDNGWDTTYTYKCQLCGQLRNETQDNSSKEIIETDIIIQGELEK